MALSGFSLFRGSAAAGPTSCTGVEGIIHVLSKVAFLGGTGKNWDAALPFGLILELLRLSVRCVEVLGGTGGHWVKSSDG